MIGGVARGAGAIRVAVGAARFVDELSQRHRRAAGLRAEPFPVPRQQRHLARDDAEFRPPASARLRRRGLVGCGFRIRGRLRQPRQDFALGAAKIEIDRAAGGVAENHDRRRRRPSGRIHDRKRDLGERARPPGSRWPMKAVKLGRVL